MLTLFLSAAVAVAIAWFIRDPDKDYIMPGVSNGVVLGLRESDKTKKKGELVSLKRRKGAKVIAEKLTKGKGLRVPGIVSGMLQKQNEDRDVIVVEVGKSITTDGQRFSIRIPKGMGLGLMNAELDIILAVKEKEKQ